MKKYLRCKPPSGTDSTGLAQDTALQRRCLMATGSSTKTWCLPEPQGIKTGKHQAKGQEEQKKKEEGGAQGRRRALKWPEGPGRWKGEALAQLSISLAPGCGSA